MRIVRVSISQVIELQITVSMLPLSIVFFISFSLLFGIFIVVRLFFSSPRVSSQWYDSSFLSFLSRLPPPPNLTCFCFVFRVRINKSLMAVFLLLFSRLFMVCDGHRNMVLGGFGYFWMGYGTVVSAALQSPSKPSHSALPVLTILPKTIQIFFATSTSPSIVLAYHVCFHSIVRFMSPWFHDNVGLNTPSQSRIP